MSPLVQRPRSGGVRPDPTDQHWSMLLFESASAGVMTIFVGFVLVLSVVGIYVIIVWPLTFWDLTNAGLEKLRPWVNTILWSIFAGGSLAGYWYFSGRAFKSKAKPRVAGRSATSRR